MTRIIRTAVLSLVCAAAAAEPPPSGDVVSGVWQHHKATINYFGITSAYACDALEDHVKSILLLFGARRDAKVSATGCPYGPNVPSHDAWIETDFYSLTPEAPAAGADAVKAQWAAREVTPRQPYYMGEGDCELIEQMKDLISKNFSLRDVVYRTDCVPHQITVNGFTVKGQALIPVAQTANLKGG